MDASIYLLEYIRHRKNFEQVQAWLDAGLFDDDGASATFKVLTKAMKFDDCKIVDYPQINALGRQTLKDPDQWEAVAKTCQRMAKVRKKSKVIERMSRRFLVDRHMLQLIQDEADDIGSGHGANPGKLRLALSKLESIGESDGIQVDIYREPTRHYEDLVASGRPVPTPLAPMTQALDGGPCGGDLVTIMALPDGGKTLLALDWAVTASENGIPTFVGVLERGRVCKSRLYCRITRHSARWLNLHRVDFEKIVANAAQRNAPLRLMDYSRREVSVSDIRRDVGRFVDEYGSVGCVIVDYGDLIRSSRRYDSKRHELDLVWVELSRLGQEFGAAVIVPTQSNRRGTQVNTLDMSNAAEAWAKMHTTDIVLTINQTGIEKTRDMARIAIVKTKKTGGYQVVPVRLDRLKCSMQEIIHDHGTQSRDNKRKERASRDSDSTS